MYALQHPRTRTLHTIYNFCTFYFYLDVIVYALTFITMFFILAFILILLILQPRGTHLVPRHW